MGSLFSSTRRLEQRLLKTQSQIKHANKKIDGLRRSGSFVSFVTTFFIICVLCESAASYYFVERSYRYELLILTFLVLVRLLFQTFSYTRIRTLQERLITLQYNQRKYMEEYLNRSSIKKARQLLKRSGHQQLLNIVKAEDVGVVKTKAEKQSLIKRIAHLIVKDGPDYRCAIICPSCRSHNGLIDPSEYSRLMYTCKYCKHFVSATEILREPEEDTIDEDKEVNLSSDEYSDELPPMLSNE